MRSYRYENDCFFSRGQKTYCTRKVFHLASFWKWEFLELGNGMSQSIAIFVIIIIIIIYLFIYLSFRHAKNRNSTELSKHVWTLKENNINYSIAWRILSSHLPYNSSSKQCNLCLKEKFLIICRPELSTLNKRNELVSSCSHRNKALLRNNWCNEPRTE